MVVIIKLAKRNSTFSTRSLYEKNSSYFSNCVYVEMDKGYNLPESLMRCCNSHSESDVLSTFGIKVRLCAQNAELLLFL